MEWRNIERIEIEPNGNTTRFYCNKSGRFVIEVRRWLKNPFDKTYVVSCVLIDHINNTKRQFPDLESAKKAAEDIYNEK